MQAPANHEGLKAELARYLSGKRLAHSHAVAEIAVQLAHKHAPELSEQAYLAGLLHDNAKHFSDAELTAEARRLDIVLTDEEANWPQLLHGKVGAALLPERFGVTALEVRQAVADHVTGRAGMGLLSVLLYVADQAAADRSFPGVEELRAAAREDLVRACWLTAKHKLAYILTRQRRIALATVELYNEYLGLLQAQSGSG